jgi:flavin reductase (DIM6/NTAB) family NADH-FMN oxidoreductase RutF
LSPRIVVLITTVDKNGRINAMPASFVSPVNFSPPIVMVSVAYTRDTYKNLEEVPEFVANILSKDYLDRVLGCAHPYERGVNELEKVGLSWVKAKKVKPSIVKEADAWLECKVVDSVKFKDHAAIFGEVVACDCKKPIEEINPIMHIAGNEFAVDFKTVKCRRYD